MKTIAVLGASNNHRKYGNKCVRAYQHAGWKVLPVSLSGEEVEGLPSYRNLAEVREALGDDTLDRISVYLPPPVSLELLPEMAEADAEEVWFNPGAADQSVLSKAEELGVNAIPACSIVDIGLSPGQFP